MSAAAETRATEPIHIGDPTVVVRYEPPLTGSSAHHGESLLAEAVLEGPPYIRTRAAGRWHRVRSSSLRIYEWDPDVIRQHWHYWCGPMVGTRSQSGPPLLTDQPPAGAPRCGTCEGRYAGATDHGDPDWLFTPRGLTPPRVCPAAKTMWVTEDPTNFRRGTCLACGERVKLGAYGSWYASDWGVRSHAPGPGLIPGCEFHGWRELTIARGLDGKPAVACRCQTVPSRKDTA
jgi:hypothetical protein